MFIFSKIITLFFFVYPVFCSSTHEIVVRNKHYQMASIGLTTRKVFQQAKESLAD